MVFLQNIVHYDADHADQPNSSIAYFYMDHPYVEGYNPLDNPIVDVTNVYDEVLKCGTLREVGKINEYKIRILLCLDFRNKVIV